MAGPLLIVDGTVIQTFRSVLKFENGENDPYFNGHKWKHGINMLAFVDYTGKIWWNTRVYPGGFVDQQIWNIANLRNYFSESKVTIIGDRGFTFNKKNEQHPINSFNPFSYGNANLSQTEKEISHFISSRRSMVEHVFKRIKDWKIIGGLCRHFIPFRQGDSSKYDYLNIDHVLDVICCIHNIDIETHPMRVGNNNI